MNHDLNQNDKLNLIYHRFTDTSVNTSIEQVAITEKSLDEWIKEQKEIYGKECNIEVLIHKEGPSM